MFNKMKILIASALCMLSAVAVAESSVSLSQASIRANIGDKVSVKVQMSGFPTTEGGGIDVHFDPAVARVNSVVVDGVAWTFVNSNGAIDNGQGVVSGVLFSNYQGVSGSANIATIEFEFVGKGRSQITLSESASNPFASNGGKVAVTFNPTDVRVRR